MRVIVTYDVIDDKIRGRLFRLLERYGAWKQYSVFEMELTPVQQAQLEHKIRTVIAPQDRVRIYMLCDRCVGKIKDLGVSTPDRASNVI